MRRVVGSAVVLFVALLWSLPTAGANDGKPGAAEDSEKPVVLLNATAKLGYLGPVDKIRRVLDTRGLLLEIPDGLAAALDGRALQIADVDAIREAYTRRGSC